MKLLRRWTPAWTDSKGNPLPGSIALLDRPSIGGIRQGILVRGQSIENPALLLLHGGPGGAYIGCARMWFGALERDWVVINWDMRGAGLSYSRQLDPGSLNGPQLGRDACEVLEYVENRVGIRGAYLLAHSFGTRVAPFVLRAMPERFAGYFAVSGAPTDDLAEAESYAWTLLRAEAIGQRRAVHDLKRIGPPPYRSETGGLELRARWTDRLGGAAEGSDGEHLTFRALRAGTEYTWGDLFRRLLPGVGFWMRNMDGTLAIVPGRVESPVTTTFVQGADDWMTPTAASRRTFERLIAPSKNFIELPGVGHYPFVGAPDAFAAALLSQRQESLTERT